MIELATTPEQSQDEGRATPEAEALALVLADPLICGYQFNVTMYDEDWRFMAEAIIEKLGSAGYLVVHEGTVPTGWRGWNPC